MVATVIDVPIVGQSYHLKDWSIDCQRTVNLYPQVVESGNSPNVSALLPTPGLVRRFELSGQIRGLYALTHHFLCIADHLLYKIDKSGKTTEIGTISGNGAVYFADNSVHVMIVSSANAYKYTLADDSLEELIIDDDTGFLGASDVTFLDSRFIYTVPNSGQLQWSNLLNTNTSALNYATAEAKSDNLVRTIAVNGQLWLIGEKTTEIWNSTGDNDMPFRRMSGAYIPIGCGAKNSVCMFGSSLVFLSQTEHGQAQIVMTEGYSAKRISNHAIEAEISRYTQINDAYAFVYQQEGHAFYVLTFPSAKKTWCFDAITQMWHERSFYNPQTYQQEHHRALNHCFFNGEHLVGDRENGLIYRLCLDCEKDDGHTIIRERVTPIVNPQALKLVFHELELICQVGQDENIEPLIMLDWSIDGGKTWSNDRQLSLGKVGEYGKRIIFRRLGQSYKRVFRIRMSDAGRLILLGAKAKVS